MDTDAAVPWVPVASFLGPYAEVEADLLVTHLQGSGVPVLRVPMNQPISVLFTHGMPGTFPIRVYVPPEHLEDARELAAEQEPQSVPRPLRAVAQWWAASMVLSPIVVAAYGARETASRMGGVLSLGIGLGLLWRGL